MKPIVLVIVVLFLATSTYGQEVSREQLKGLDEQVQEIKSDVLAIAAELNQLEEKLLFPSNTQLAVFISMGADEDFRLDSVEIQLGGKPVAYHIYTFKELDALRRGGVQRIYTGNIRTGAHDLEVTMAGKIHKGSAFDKSERFAVNKGVGPKIVELSLTDAGITFRDR
ncbi:MAG: hypothetical protein PVG51_01015 [Desulfosarcina sp.]|jgi:hypothetical protein